MAYTYESLGSANNTFVINNDIKQRLLEKLKSDLSAVDGFKVATYYDETYSTTGVPTSYVEDRRDKDIPASPLDFTVAITGFKYAVSSTEKVLGILLDVNDFYISDTIFDDANCIRVEFTLVHATTDTFNYIILYDGSAANDVVYMHGYIPDRVIDNTLTGVEAEDNTFYAYIKI